MSQMIENKSKNKRDQISKILLQIYTGEDAIAAQSLIKIVKKISLDPQGC